jgi:accessory gene regulator B
MIADRIINNVSSDAKLDMEYRDIYVYSLERYLSNLFNLIIFIITAIVFRVPGEAIAFAIFYGPLRKYAGGLHVKSRSLCLILSLTIMLAIIRLSKELAFLTGWRLISGILLIIACFLIYKLAPVASSRRPLSAETRVQFRKRARWIVTMEGGLLVLGMIVIDIYESIIILGVLALLLEGVFLIPNNLDL